VPCTLYTGAGMVQGWCRDGALGLKQRPSLIL
jgi:hypothetical protein